MGLKIWLVSQNENNGYDTFSAMVVAAETEDEARRIHPLMSWFEREDPWKDEHSLWASKPENVTVKLIGTAELDAEKGIILASFHPG